MISPHRTGLKFREDYDAEACGKVLLNENVVEEKRECDRTTQDA